MPNLNDADSSMGQHESVLSEHMSLPDAGACLEAASMSTGLGVAVFLVLSFTEAGLAVSFKTNY